MEQQVYATPGESLDETQERLENLRAALKSGELADRVLTRREAGSVVNRKPTCIAQWCTTGRPEAGILRQKFFGSNSAIRLSDLLEYEAKVRPVGAPRVKKLSDDDVRSIRESFELGVYNMRELAERYDVDISYISKIINRERKTNVK